MPFVQFFEDNFSPSLAIFPQRNRFYLNNFVLRIL
jgi:hypothetical protein